MAATALDTPCREYRGATRNGYGIRSRGTPPNRTRTLLHRWIWEQINGPVPAGMVVMHRCDNPPCFRYDHLRLGTQQDNIADMHAKGRASGGSHRNLITHCPQGHPYDEANTYFQTDKRGRTYRQCKQCTSDRMKMRNQRLKEARAQRPKEV